MNHWLLKTEPETWSWDMQLAKGVEPWTGVRNPQAAKFMKDMRKGERAFFYHTGNEKRIVGVVEVVGEAHADPTDDSGRFVAVDVKTLHPLVRPVTLATIKADPSLTHLALVRQARLSVMPIDPAAWAHICALGGIAP